MNGVFLIRLPNATKRIHLHNVASVQLQKTAIRIEYNFPCVTGKSFYEKVESRPAFEEFTWATEAEANTAFQECKVAFQELR